MPVEHTVVNQSNNPFLSQTFQWKLQNSGSTIGYLGDSGLVPSDNVPSLINSSFASSQMDIASGPETPQVTDTMGFNGPNSFHKIQNQALQLTEGGIVPSNPHHRHLAQTSHLTEAMNPTSLNPFHRHPGLNPQS